MRGLAQITAISGIGVFCRREKHFRSADDVGQEGVRLPANMMQRFWEDVFFLNCRQVFENVEEDL